MPFTFAHPAIVLPLGRLPKHWVSMGGLITGTMTPDFEYFIRMRVLSVYSHTWAGLLWFDVPLGMILALIYIGYVRLQLIRHLPAVLNSRLSAFDSPTKQNVTFRYLLIVAVSVLVGAATHIFWDSFTHAGDHFVKRIPLLTKELSLLGRHIPVFKLAQHLSTLIGGIAILMTVYFLPKGAITRVANIKPFWLKITLLTVLITIIRFCCEPSAMILGYVIVTVIGAGFIGLLGVSLWYKKSGADE